MTKLHASVAGAVFEVASADALSAEAAERLLRRYTTAASEPRGRLELTFGDEKTDPDATALLVPDGPRIGWAAVRSGLVRVSWTDLNAVSRGIGLLLGTLRRPPEYHLLHGAALRFGQKALVATGVSGAGKSTLSSLFQEAELLSDELVVIQTGERPRVHSTPVQSNAARERSCGSAELVAVLGLEKTPAPDLVPMRKVDALRLMLEQTFVGTEPRPLEQLEAVSRITRVVPAFTLRFAKDRSFVPLLLDLLR